MQTPHMPQIRRTYAAVAGVASLALLATTPSVAANAAVQPPEQAPVTAISSGTRDHVRVPDDVRLRETHRSLLAVHKWYQQYAGGNPVYGGWWATHRDKVTGRVTVYDGRRKVRKLAPAQPAIGQDEAVRSANRASKTVPADVTTRQLMVLPDSGATGVARLTWAIGTADGRGARISFVDAVTGQVVKTVSIARKARHGEAKTYTGTAQVFDPNPVVKLQDETLTDQHDSATAVPDEGYTMRALRRMDDSGRLSGLWVKITNQTSPESATRTFVYDRHNNFFEQANAYYSVDVLQAYLHDLGFGDANAERQKVATDAFPDDNSYYDPLSDKISLGSGGVDDAEDPEVVWHEYGHAIQDAQVPDYGQSNQAGAMGEGFGDYMAVTMGQQEAPDGTAVTPTPCVMDWDATSYTSGEPHCLRRTDKPKYFTPRTANQREVHEFGEVWSHALWDMNESMGRDDATKVIIEAQFWMNQRITMPGAAKIMVAVARKMGQRGLIAPSVRKVRTAMLDRRILR